MNSRERLRENEGDLISLHLSHIASSTDQANSNAVQAAVMIETVSRFLARNGLLSLFFQRRNRLHNELCPSWHFGRLRIPLCIFLLYKYLYMLYIPRVLCPM
jgi:hypothetical protein